MRRETLPNSCLENGDTVEITDRMTTKGLSEALLGGLAYLKDSHVSEVNNFSGKVHNFSIHKRSKFVFALQIISRFRSFLGKMIIKEKHLKGSWPGFIRYLPSKGFRMLLPLFTVTDYNLSTTASTAYSLLFFDDRSLPAGKRFVSDMLESASGAIQTFRRGSAYNFWETHSNPAISYPYSAPINIPVSIIDFRRSIYDRTGFLGLKSFYESDVLMEWIDRIYDIKQNKTGSTALFNIPNDSDNSSLAVGFLMQYQRWKNNSIPDTDLTPLDLFPSFRDLNRKIADRHNKCMGHETGAFLTWLKNEDANVFSNPESGIIPLAVNNVDIVVNANILFTLSLAEKRTMPGYREAVRLIARVIKEGIWPEASLYYPERMFFPYAVSRAVRDAGLDEPEINEVLPKLLDYIFEQQKAFETSNPSLAGAIPGVNRESLTLATALGLITMLNLSGSIARMSGVDKIYDKAIEKAICFLLSVRKPDRINQVEPGNILTGITPNYWESGILYSSSVQQLAYWQSHAQTTSIVIEALVKFLLGYDKKFNFKQVPHLYINKTGTRISLSLDKQLF